MIPSLLNSLILLPLGLIHFNWVLGGTWGFEASLPTKESGERVLNPKKIDSLIVGLGLTGFALFYFIKSGITDWFAPTWVMTYGSWIIPGIFLLRAIGDFRYVGFFKRIKNTEFARNDTRLFAPLCLMIAVLGSATNI
jgi:hypothetical protein